MVVRTTPKDYFKGELMNSAKIRGVVPMADTIAPSLVNGYVPVQFNSNASVIMNDSAFKYIVFFGLTIVSLITIKYLFEK